MNNNDQWQTGNQGGIEPYSPFSVEGQRAGNGGRLSVRAYVNSEQDASADPPPGSGVLAGVTSGDEDGVGSTVADGVVTGVTGGLVGGASPSHAERVRTAAKTRPWRNLMI